MNVPSMRLYGKTRLQILSHKGLCGYSDTEISVYSTVGTICVGGKEYISIKGSIERIAYQN